MNRRAAKQIMTQVIAQVPAYKQVGPAVLVIVDESGRNGPALCTYTGLVRNIFKSAGSRVSIQSVAAISGDVKVGVAVVVKVTRRHAHAVAVLDLGESRAFRHVSERAILILPVQAIPISR